MSRVPGTPVPLHVLILTPFFPSDKNEVSGCYVAEPIVHFKEVGVESSVIAVSPLHHPPRHSIPSAAGEWLRFPQIPGVFGLSTAGSFLSARLLSRVQKLHREKPIHIIHAHAALPCGHAAALLSERLGVRFVVTVHGLDVFNACHLGGVPAVWRRNVSLKVYAVARNVICISSKVQEVLKSGMPPEIRSTVVHNGVDPDLFSPGISSSAHADPTANLEILDIGTLLPSKGHELVLRAMAKLKLCQLPVRCRIIGEGPDRSRFEALASELGIEQQVQFVGRQSRMEVAQAMRRCSAFVLPSWNEGLGCVYLEAMSCSKPVIGCRGQGIEDVVEHGRNGWLIAPDSLEDLVQGLSVLLGSFELRKRMGTAARETILEKFTLMRHAQRLAEVYHQAIA